MKKKVVIILLSCLLLCLLTSCDEVLSVVTCNENGEKVVNSYISALKNKVYDESSSPKNWQELELFGDMDFLDINQDDLLFKIIKLKEKIVVVGNKEAAVEIVFFDGGYDYTVYVSMDEVSKSVEEMADNISNAFNDSSNISDEFNDSPVDWWKY